MTTYKELADAVDNVCENGDQRDEIVAILRSLDAQKPIGYWGGAFSIEGGADLYEVEQVSAFGRVYKNLPLYAAPVAAQPPSQPVDPVHVINTAIDVMMRRDATIAGVLFDFMGWLTTRKERLCLSSADDASPAVTAITEFAKMRNLSLDNARERQRTDMTYQPYNEQTANTTERIAWALCQIIDDDAPMRWTRYRTAAVCIAFNTELMNNLQELAKEKGRPA